MVTLNNSAEFGSSAGAITSLVTKSGTNAAARQRVGVFS